MAFDVCLSTSLFHIQIIGNLRSINFRLEDVEKVERIATAINCLRAHIRTASSTPRSRPFMQPVLTHRHRPFDRLRVMEHLDQFNPFSVDEMDKFIMAAPNKQCDLDPVPTWLINKFHHIIGPGPVFDQCFTEPR
jgi:hypothetical protein